MMYDTVLGGIGTGANRAVVYTGGDGTNIGYNNVPSQSDVANVSRFFRCTKGRRFLPARSPLGEFFRSTFPLKYPRNLISYSTS